MPEENIEVTADLHATVSDRVLRVGLTTMECDRRVEASGKCDVGAGRSTRAHVDSVRGEHEVMARVAVRTAGHPHLHDERFTVVNAQRNGRRRVRERGDPRF